MEPVEPAIPQRPPIVLPVTPGRLVLRTLGVWSHHAIPFTAVALLFQLPLAALALRAGPALKDGGRFALFALFGWLLNVVASASLTHGVLSAFAGKRPGVAAMLTAGGRRLWPVFTAALLYGLTVLAGSFLLVVPGILAMVGGFLTLPAALAEPGLGAEGALRRSWSLTDGHRLQVFGAAAILMALEALAALAVNALGTGPGAPSPAAVVAIDALASAVLGGLTSCCAAVAYHDLRHLEDVRARPSPSPRG